VTDGIRVGIDVGGTFTDIYHEDVARGERRIAKIRTSVVQEGGLPEGLAASSIDLTSPRDLVYSTTLATNAILERTLGRCALVTTRGFRDVIDLGRRERPRTYGLDGDFEPLVPRSLRFEVDERVAADGAILTRPSEDEVRALCRTIAGAEVGAVVISFLNAYANGENEREVAAIVRDELEDMPLVIGSEVHPEWGEFERTTLAVLHGSLTGLVGGHLDSRRKEFTDLGFRGSLFVMQSNGGVIPLERAARRPANLLLSGPAAGVIGASAQIHGREEEFIVTCDMGGTSFDVGMLRNGRPVMTSRSEIAFRVPLLMPTVDVHEIAAGGGSVANVVGGRLLTVGPESVGSLPGPACYGLGGERPTITDAALILNRFVEGQRFGSVGEIEPDRALAIGAVQRHVADPLGISATEAAEAIIATAATVMAGGVRTMSVGRGLDPRTTLLFVAGGAGPLFACDFAGEAGVRQIIVPRYPGVTNAIGCATTDLRQDYSRTVNAVLGDEGLATVAEVLREQRMAGESFLQEIGESARADPVFAVELEMQYVGQTHTVTVALANGRLEQAAIEQAFQSEYAKWQGIPMDGAPVNVRTVRSILVVPRQDFPDGARPSRRHVPDLGPATPVARQSVHVARTDENVCVYDRDLLRPGQSIAGPALIRQLDCTVWLAPGSHGCVDGAEALVIDMEG
jgi:N-methylhydantoinase A